MKIAAAKTEGTHGGSPRMPDRLYPRTGFRVHVQRRIVGQERSGRSANLDRWWEHFVLKSENRLDDSRRSGCGLGVTDLRLD